MPDTSDLLNHVVDASPVDFADTFNQLMSQKAAAAIEAHREYLAQSIYSSAEDEDQDPEDDDDVEDTEEDEEFEDEDFDLDLDELDLDDEDLDDLDDGDDTDADA